MNRSDLQSRRKMAGVSTPLVQDFVCPRCGANGHYDPDGDGDFVCVSGHRSPLPSEELRALPEIEYTNDLPSRAVARTAPRRLLAQTLTGEQIDGLTQRLSPIVARLRLLLDIRLDALSGPDPKRLQRADGIRIADGYAGVWALFVAEAATHEAWIMASSSWDGTTPYPTIFLDEVAGIVDHIHVAATLHGVAAEDAFALITPLPLDLVEVRSQRIRQARKAMRLLERKRKRIQSLLKRLPLYLRASWVKGYGDGAGWNETGRQVRWSQELPFFRNAYRSYRSSDGVVIDSWPELDGIHGADNLRNAWKRCEQVLARFEQQFGDEASD